jgi:hypothetical protein
MSSIAVPAQTAPSKRWLFWIGWIVSLWPAYVVLSSATWKLTRNAWYVAEFARIGWQESALNLLAFLQLGAIALFLFPRTAILGAILLTGYLGGAIATYVRIGEPYPVVVPLSTSLVAWLGIYLREPRLRAIVPFR